MFIRTIGYSFSILKECVDIFISDLCKSTETEGYKNFFEVETKKINLVTEKFSCSKSYFDFLKRTEFKIDPIFLSLPSIGRLNEPIPGEYEVICFC